MKLRISIVCMALALATGGCGNKDKGKDVPKEPAAPAPAPVPVTPGPGSAAPAPVTPGSGAGSAATHPSQAKTAVVRGSACPKDMRPVTDVPVKLAGGSLSFTRDRGGGCPQRPVYTAVYAEGEPIKVRLCYDPGADACEMMIMAEQVTIDLGGALGDSGATSAVLEQ